MKNKNWIISIALGLIFLFLWIKIVDWDKLISYFKHINLKYAIFFSLFYILAYFFRSLRWRIILKPVYKMKIGESFTVFMTGMLINYLIPVRIGEIAKSVILKNKKNVSMAASLPTIFIDKLSDFFPILIILALAPLLSVKFNATLKIVLLLLIVIFLMLIFFVFFSVKYKKFAQRMIELFFMIFPRSVRNKFTAFSSSFIDGMAVMKGRYGAWVLIIMLTLLAVLSETIYVFAVFHAFGSEISFAKILFGYTLMNLTYILPTPPAQVGSNQFMWTLIFSFALGEDKNLAGAAVTFSHLLTGSIIFAVGYFSFLVLKINYKDLLSYKK